MENKSKSFLVTVTPVQDNPETKKKNSLSAADRKNIKAICTMKDMKNYEFIDEMLDYHIANKLNLNEQNNLNDIMRVLQNQNNSFLEEFVYEETEFLCCETKCLHVKK